MASKEKFGSKSNENAVGEWWDSTSSCTGPSCCNVTEAYVGGFIRSCGSENSDDELNTTTINDKKDVSLKFVNTTSQKLILCWVSETGELHHFYPILPHKNHVEISTEGHAFIISSCTMTDRQRKEKQREEDEIPQVNEQTIVAAYRVTSSAVSDHLILIKSFPIRAVAAAANTNNNIRKKKWKLYPFIDNERKVYTLEKVGPWRLQVEPGCWDDGENNNNVFKNQFQSDLMAATDRLPKHAVEKLAKTTTFWINKSWLQGRVNDPTSEDGACFHEDQEWLKSNFHSIDKKFGIEFYSTDEYLTDFHLWGPGGVILHELSHAWHRLHVKYGYNNRDIIKCYRLAMKEKMYECVQYHTLEGVNDETRAYACNNAAEYFAELSVAFFSDGCSLDHQTVAEDGKDDDDGDVIEYNKWFPFTRKQLQQHDPRAYALLQQMWDVHFTATSAAVYSTSVSSTSSSAHADSLGDWWDSTFSSSPECQNVTTAFAAGLIKSIENDEDEDNQSGEEAENEEAEDENEEEDKELENEESEDEDNEIEVRFLNKSRHTLVLCWVSHSGDLHHYYRILPNETHMESTKIGDAFVLSVLDDSKAKSNKRKPLVNEQTVVAAYRPMYDFEKDHFVVIKEFPPKGFAKNKRLRGTSDGVVGKSKWKLYIR